MNGICSKEDSAIKVIYIAGPARSGSTLVGRILGQVDGFFNAGELVEFWDRGLNWNCSCGSITAECQIWSQVLIKMANTFEKGVLKDIVALRDIAASSRRALKSLVMGRAESIVRSQFSNLLLSVSNVYETVRCITGCKVIVDCSKNPGFAHIIGMAPMIDLYVVHLVRDSRAVAYSWSRRKDYLWKSNPVLSALLWDIRNIVTEMMGRRRQSRYLRLNYETFVQNPREAVERILAFAKECSSELPFVTEGTVELGVSHGLCGNPDRFRTGLVEIKMDERWKQMKTMDRIVVNTLTWPLLVRYGYPALSS